MIYRKSIPFAGGPVLLSGSTFQNMQQLLLHKYAAYELEEVLNEKRLSFPTNWTVIGNTNQLTHLSYQKEQGRLIFILTGSAYILIINPDLKAIHPDPVIFRLTSGLSEAVWVPPSYAQGFLFLTNNTISLTAATTERTENMKFIDPSKKIDLSNLTDKSTSLTLSKLVEI